MMAERFDVIVVGVGAMGAAACFHLAKRGVRVLGLEQCDILHSFGSYHGHSRMIRKAYFEHPDYVPLLQRAYALWGELEARSGQTLWVPTGGLYASPPNGKVVSGCLRASEQHGLDYQCLDHDEAAGRFPGLMIPEGFEVFYERDAGVLLSESAIAAWVEQSLQLGADLRAREGVVDWAATDRGVTVTTAQGRYRAGQLVLCCGAWAGRVLGRLGVPLNVTRQTMAWFGPKEPAAFVRGRFPVWFIENEVGAGVYGFPQLPGQPGVKVASHQPGPPTQPDAVDREIAASDRTACRAIVRRFLPRANGPLLALKVCLYTHTPDSHFVIDRHPAHPNVAIACGFSGHGFKFASVVGEILADIALNGRTEHPIDFLRLARFGV